MSQFHSSGLTQIIHKIYDLVNLLGRDVEGAADTADFEAKVFQSGTRPDRFLLANYKTGFRKYFYSSVSVLLGFFFRVSQGQKVI